MDDIFKSIGSRSFYGLPPLKHVLFEDEVPVEDQENVEDHGEILYSELIDSDPNSDTNDGNSSDEDFMVTTDEENENSSEYDSDDNIPLAELRNRLETWNAVDCHIGPDTLPMFQGLHKVNINAVSALEIFLSLIDENMIDEIVYQSNLYAHQKGKDNLGITKRDLYTFIGITFVMSYIRYPRIRLYWSSEEGLRMDLIANAMSVNRYEAILRYLHFVENPVPGQNRRAETSSALNNREKQENDKLWKLRPFLDKLQENFLKAVDPEENQSVDEQVIPMKSRISIKQYLPKKPKKWGIKNWVRAGISGYVYRFEIYQGAKHRAEVSKLGACGDVVLRLCNDIENKNHKVFFDNLFCSIELLEELRKIGIYGTGTMRSNRLRGAKEILPTDKDMGKQLRELHTSQLKMA